jgi:6-phosphogluconolactonase
MKFLLTPLLLLTLTCHAQDEYYLLTGTYTGGKSKGIYVHSFNTKTGMSRELSVTEASNPSYIAASADGRFVYAVHEDGKESGGGKISAYSFDASTGKLSLINTQSTEGDHPCYVAVHPSGKMVVAGNYTGGNVAAFAVGSDGSLGKASSFPHSGSSINKDRQEKPHVHCTVFTPDAKQLWVADLGIDKLVPYEVDPASQMLSPSLTEPIPVEPGSGPRHLTFDPVGKFAYLVEELSGTVVVYKWKKNGLKMLQRLSTLSPGQKNFAGSADIRVSPDGRYLYVSNRADYNNIAIFRIDPKKGTLSLRGHQPTGGKAPRHMQFDPTGKFLLVGNQNSDQVVLFAYNAATGALQDTGNRISIGKPVSFAWIKKP